MLPPCLHPSPEAVPGAPVHSPRTPPSTSFLWLVKSFKQKPRERYSTTVVGVPPVSSCSREHVSRRHRRSGRDLVESPPDLGTGALRSHS